MNQYFLGIDIGGTKSHALIADAFGNALGFGKSGSGNPGIVGYKGLTKVLHDITEQAIVSAGINKEQIAGTGIGIAGYNWLSQQETFLNVAQSLELSSLLEIVNDTIIGLLAGATKGWGIAVVAGTSCNCRGWDQNRREGRVTGGGFKMGEAAGGAELLIKAIQAISFEWTQRGQPTKLTQAFMQLTGADSAENLLEGLATRVYRLRPAMVPTIFQVADEGDPIAREIIIWAGQELGAMVIGVIHQLSFKTLAFDVVLVGSLFKGSLLLIQTLDETIHKVAPGACLVQLAVPPVIGGVLLGLEKAGIECSPTLRTNLSNSTTALLTRKRLEFLCLS